ncbi:C4-dicarboxylate ABC transporter [Candidatus Bipolaricaulota bacterium]|nr:C4-dicarboxylate ABC transporter [Candidatus Bipolaricaulota bacterium]
MNEEYNDPAAVVNDSVNPVRNFSPAWFAVIMGTGILVTTSISYASYIPALRTVGQVLFYINAVLFALFLTPWIMRWLFYRKEALQDLNHPINANFYPTFPAAIVILGSNFMSIEKLFNVGLWMWVVGSAITVIFAFVVPYITFKGEHVTLDHISPALFIPPVALLVIPIVGNSLIGHFSGWADEWIIFANYFGLGAGFFIYLALLAVSMYRFIIHHPLPNVLAPTIWINLGPIGATILALYKLAPHGAGAANQSPIYLFGFLLWGFGVWWVGMAIMLTIHYIRRLKLPYAMSWWAFTFPLGAYVAASHAVGQVFSPLVDYMGLSLYFLLFALWTITLVNTIVHGAKGDLFRAR